jgi:hypothetical protein
MICMQSLAVSPHAGDDRLRAVLFTASPIVP